MIWFIRTFWKSLLAVTMVLGIIGIPKDIQDRGQLLEPYQRVLAMFDQNTALWIACLGLVGWLVWTDVRPFVRARLRKKPPALHIEKLVAAESERILEADDRAAPDLHLVRFFILVKNNQPDQRTLRRVSAKFHWFGEPRPLFCRSGDETTDLRHGETAYFELGTTVVGEHVGMPSAALRRMTPEQIVRARENVQHRHAGIEIAGDYANPVRIVFPQSVETSGLAGLVIVAADDVPYSAVSVHMDTRKLPDLQAAFRVTDVAQ